ncbi:hypothetical protein NITHO_2030003 [Nitrolancea hollandica Lb]|uniref:Uncharacterized protein n=1 Tax=Nitrolancea hollandica Lb TaxID=1129897 RepID=I4EEU9_9BACT|nr:hypothetical protein NITHO_2030003 [Nitrolancea hollandica Lb]
MWTWKGVIELTMALSKEEQSTQIYTNAASDTAEVYSEEPATIRQLRKLAKDHSLPLHVTPYGIGVTVPRSWVQVQPPFTDTRRARLSEAGKAGMAKRWKHAS